MSFFKTFIPKTLIIFILPILAFCFIGSTKIFAGPGKWFRGPAKRLMEQAGEVPVQRFERLVNGHQIGIQVLPHHDVPLYGVTVGGKHSFLIEENRIGGLVGDRLWDHELRVLGTNSPTMGRLEFGGRGSMIELKVAHGIPKGFGGVADYQYHAGTALKAVVLNMYATPGTLVRSDLVNSNLAALKRVFRASKFPTAEALATVPALHFGDLEFALNFRGSDAVELVLHRPNGINGIRWGEKNYRSLYTSTGINPRAENFIHFLERYTMKSPEDVLNFARP